MATHTFSQTFLALLKEAQFTKEMLGTGATQIRKATYASKGIYFQAFTSLCTGLERAGKLSIIIDHYIDHGAFPDAEFMRRSLRHNLITIEQKLGEIVTRRQLVGQFLQRPTDPIHTSILAVLSDFAGGDRYSNINLLVNDRRQSDPVATWFNTVDQPLFEQKVSSKRKATIPRNAELAEAMLGSFSTVLHNSETGSTITTMEDASYRTGVYNSIAPYRQLYVLQIIRYWTQVLSELHYAGHASGDIPHLGEIFAIFYNDDRYLKSRKTWENV